MATLHRLPHPQDRHPSMRLVRKRARLTPFAHRLGIVLLAGGTGAALGITLTARPYPHPGAIAAACVALLGAFLSEGGR